MLHSGGVSPAKFLEGSHLRYENQRISDHPKSDFTVALWDTCLIRLPYRMPQIVMEAVLQNAASLRLEEIGDNGATEELNYHTFFFNLENGIGKELELEVQELKRLPDIFGLVDAFGDCKGFLVVEEYSSTTITMDIHRQYIWTPKRQLVCTTAGRFLCMLSGGERRWGFNG